MLRDRIARLDSISWPTGSRCSARCRRAARSSVGAQAVRDRDEQAPLPAPRRGHAGTGASAAAETSSTPRSSTGRAAGCGRARARSRAARRRSSSTSSPSACSACPIRGRRMPTDVDSRSRSPSAGAARAFVARARPGGASARAAGRGGSPRLLARPAGGDGAASATRGMTFPERWGGAGLGLRELGIVAEELGSATSSPTPMLSGVLGAGALALARLRARCRPTCSPACARATGSSSLALDEGRRFSPVRVATRAERRDGRLARHRREVLRPRRLSSPDSFVVVARTGGAPGDRDGLTLLHVPRDDRRRDDHAPRPGRQPQRRARAVRRGRRSSASDVARRGGRARPTCSTASWIAAPRSSPRRCSAARRSASTGRSRT